MLFFWFSGGFTFELNSYNISFPDRNLQPSVLVYVICNMYLQLNVISEGGGIQ